MKSRCLRAAGPLVAVVRAFACSSGDGVLCGACAVGWAILRVMYVMLGFVSIQALHCTSYRCLSVCGRCERDKLVLMVPMVQTVPGWRREASWVQRCWGVAARGLVGAELLELLEVQTTRALGIAGVGTHGGRGAWACISRRLRCVLRACGACAHAVSEKGGLGPIGPSRRKCGCDGVGA